MSVTTVSSFKALVKREYWEHRGAMLITPAAIAAFFAVIMLLGVLTGDQIAVNNGHTFDFSEHLPKAVEEFEKLGPAERTQGVQIGLYAPRVLFSLVMLVIGLFYCLGSLYDERKDRSILFWKSLPVSDTATVLSKFFTVCLLIPLFYFAVTAIFQLYILMFATVGAWFGGSLGFSIWGASNLFVVLFNSLFSLIIASLWLAPIWAWLIFASSWAKKVAFLWGILPIFLVTTAEGGIFQTSNFIQLVGERIAGAFVILNSNLNRLVGNDMFDEYSTDWWTAFSHMEFWYGLIVSCIFLAGAIYTRRFRDES